jgi:hypothetical protein
MGMGYLLSYLECEPLADRRGKELVLRYRTVHLSFKLPILKQIPLSTLFPPSLALGDITFVESGDIT